MIRSNFSFHQNRERAGGKIEGKGERLPEKGTRRKPGRFREVTPLSDQGEGKETH